MKSFGHLPDGREAFLYTLRNCHNLTAEVTDFGATLVSVKTPDRDDRLEDLTLGFESVADYASDANPYFGASVGRFGNRIAHGRFSLDGREYQLAVNNAPADIPCHLHGGRVGFNRRWWSVSDHSPQTVGFEYRSPDGEEGYPGTLLAKVRYTLNDRNELLWEASATTDAPTIVNLVHHSYWNLSGDPTRSIEDHRLTLHAEQFLGATPGLIPTGEICPVAGSPMDFRSPRRVGERIDADFPATRNAAGYDGCWILAGKSDADGMRLAARMEHPGSGRVLEVLTDQPGIHFYSGNFLDPSLKGKNDYGPRSGFCLETENFPDAPNHPSFPSPVLVPGQVYRHRLVHRFSLAKNAEHP